MSDAQHYRTKDEVEEYKKIDPITQVLDIIKENNYATDAEIKDIDKNVKVMVKECEKFAEESDYPPINQLYDMVYEQEDFPFVQHKI
jgi:pyruvate dehydrogenase E1 component alpha subunit